MPLKTDNKWNTTYKPEDEKKKNRRAKIHITVDDLLAMANLLQDVHELENMPREDRMIHLDNFPWKEMQVQHQRIHDMCYNAAASLQMNLEDDDGTR